RTAPVELLQVDPRVVAPLERGQDKAGAGAVEEGDRRRLVAAGVLVGVEADDGALRDGAVDAPVDAREPGCDLVDRAVDVVDPGLERDRELDQVPPAAAD